MKKAKVKDGIIQHVWPWAKTLADGTVLVKELPSHHVSHFTKFGTWPDHIVDVPDDTQPGWRWYDDIKAYAPVRKTPREQPFSDYDSDLLAVLAEKLGLSYDEVSKEVLARKKQRYQDRKNLRRGLTPPGNKG